ncbi:hypothetical protein [Leptolyngbya iicbica]|nr:hypothetical protein [Leptolyngbya sp. LK]
MLNQLEAAIASRMTGDLQTFTVIDLTNKAGDSNPLTLLLQLAGALNELT